MSELPVSAEIQVEELVRRFPTAAAFLRQQGVVCVRCGEPAWGTLAQTIRHKGLEVEALVAALNAHLAAQSD